MYFKRVFINCTKYFTLICFLPLSCPVFIITSRISVSRVTDIAQNVLYFLISKRILILPRLYIYMC
jgi:hypothetical protein